MNGVSLSGGEQVNRALATTNASTSCSRSPNALRGPTDARTLRLARELMTERLRHSLPA
jgi:hypothetical protein